MHFNILNTCVPWYGDEEEVGAVEDENVNVRKAVGIHVMDKYNTIDPNKTTDNQQLKYPKGLKHQVGISTNETKRFCLVCF